MLAITRLPQESFTLFLEDGREIHVAVVKVEGKKVRMTVKAPRSVVILRDELKERAKK